MHKTDVGSLEQKKNSSSIPIDVPLQLMQRISACFYSIFMHCRNTLLLIFIVKFCSRHQFESVCMTFSCLSAALLCPSKPADFTDTVGGRSVLDFKMKIT